MLEEEVWIWSDSLPFGWCQNVECRGWGKSWGEQGDGEKKLPQHRSVTFGEQPSPGGEGPASKYWQPHQYHHLNHTKRKWKNQLKTFQIHIVTSCFDRIVLTAVFVELKKKNIQPVEKVSVTFPSIQKSEAFPSQSLIGKKVQTFYGWFCSHSKTTNLQKICWIIRQNWRLLYHCVRSINFAPKLQ